MRILPLIALGLSLSLMVPAGANGQQLQCNPCDHHFGRVEVGGTSTFLIHLSNGGKKPLRILLKSKVGKEFSFGEFPLPVTLRPGQTVRLPIVFKPTAAGRVTGTLTLVSTATNKRLPLPVAGRGVSGAQLTVSPGTLDFGSITVGQSATLSATLSASEGDVTISSDRLTSSEFSIVGFSLPVTIPAGQSIQAKLQFTPNQSGTASGKAGFFSNALVSPAVEQLTGKGVAPSAHSADLTWQESDTSVVGYNIYRGTTHGGPYEQINSVLDAATNYTDSTVMAGVVYYYVTTAVGASGEQSAYSNETKAVIPSP